MGSNPTFPLTSDVCRPRSNLVQRNHPQRFHKAHEVSRGPSSDTAFPLRKSGFDCFAAAAWLQPDQREPVYRWVQRFWDVSQPHSSGAYVNMFNDDEDSRVRNAYGEQYARLAVVKKRYDPDNLFRLNPNITPAV